MKNLQQFCFLKWRLAAILVLSVSLFSQCAERPVGAKQTNIQPSRTALSPGAERKFTELFFDANRAKILGNFQEAKSLFNEALAIDPGSNAVRFELAKILTDEGNLSRAIDFMKPVVAEDKENIWYAQFLAQLYAETGQTAQSIKLVKEIIENHPDQFEYYFSLGGLLAAEGKYDEALAMYDKLEAQTGPNEELSMQRQLIYMEKGDHTAALKEVDKLIENNPGEIRYYGMKAEILQQSGKKDESKSIYLDMLNIDAGNGLVLLSLYEISRREGDLVSANNYLSRAFESYDLGIDVKVNILLNFLSSGDLKQNQDIITILGEKLEKAHPDEAKAYAIQGDIYYNLGDLGKAREKFRQAVTLDGNRPPIWQQILTINSQLGDFDSLVKESEKSMELFPQQPTFYLFHGVGLLQLQKFEEAIESLNTGKNLVFDNNPLLSQFYASLGDAYFETDNHELSDSSYESALKIDPSNAVVLNNYAYHLSVRNEKLEKAETMAKKANDLRPDQPSFQDTYGWVLYMRGNFQNALFWIEQAIKNGGGNDPVVLDHYGDVLHQVNRNNEAIVQWEAAISAGGDRAVIEMKINREKAEK